MEYVHLLLSQMNFQDYFHIDQSFLFNIQDLHIINGVLLDF